jgi:hypothetical protein
VPEAIKRNLKIHLVETADEVLRLALLPKARASRAAGKGRLLVPRATRGGGTHRSRDRR